MGVIIQGIEANNIEEQPMEVTLPQVFKNKKEIMEQILAMRQVDAERAGANRGVFQRIQQRIAEEGDINLKTPAVKRLVNWFLKGD